MKNPWRENRERDGFSFLVNPRYPATAQDVFTRKRKTSASEPLGEVEEIRMC